MSSMSLKQVAALLRRAGEAARRAVADLESAVVGGNRLNGEFPRRVPSFEPALARRSRGPRFRNPMGGLRNQHTRQFSYLASAMRKSAVSNPSIKSIAYTLKHPQWRYGTMLQPRVAPFSTLSILRRPFPFALRFPSIPLHTKRCAAVDFDLTPRVLLSGRTLSTSTSESISDSINGQIAHLKAVSRDIKRIAELGELSISIENSRIRIHFDNRSSDEVETLVRDIGLSRAIVTDVVKLSSECVPPAEGLRFGDLSPGLSDSVSSATSESVWTEL